MTSVFILKSKKTSNSRKFNDILDIFNLFQSVTEPTHKQGHLLDLVLSMQSDNILLSTKLHNGPTSDRTAVLCKCDASVPLQEPETCTYRCLKKIDTNTFKQDRSDAISPNSSISNYKSHLRSFRDNPALLCCCTTRTRKQTPWLNSIVGAVL